MFKKDKMVSCRVPGCTNQVDKDFNIITLATIIMLIQLYGSIFRNLAHLMSEACSKPCQISKIMRHTGNPGILRIVYSGIFRHIQGHSAILSHV